MDPLHELLAPHLNAPPPPPQTTGAYLSRLSTLSLGDLTTTEPASLQYSSQSQLRSLQALSKRSHKATLASETHHSALSKLLPSLASQAADLKSGLPTLEEESAAFAEKYDRSRIGSAEDDGGAGYEGRGVATKAERVRNVLDRRKRALLLARNVDRVADVLDLPALLASAVGSAGANGAGAAGPTAMSGAAASGGSTAATSTAMTNTTSYASALDIYAHTRRLSGLYEHSELVNGVAGQAEGEMRNLASVLIGTLQSPGLKLAGAMRTVGWLRRVAPDLGEDGSGGEGYKKNRGKGGRAELKRGSEFTGSSGSGADGALASLFLVCRLRTLQSTLDALEPLRELADQETKRRENGLHTRLLKQQVSAGALGSQSERFLKRYIEIFREQSFNIVSMHRSVFPVGLPNNGDDGPEAGEEKSRADPLLPLPSPLASFSLHLVGMLDSTLKTYLPNITDRQARESLLTQVLYCAGSLGRLGADFSMFIAVLEEELAEESTGGEERNAGDGDDGHPQGPEWMEVMKKHRVQASRLEVLARGVGTAGKRVPSGDAGASLSPSTSTASVATG